MDTPNVIYIGGHGRSGTTVVDRVLAEITDGFSAGEVHRFWEYGLAREWTCSCGTRLRDCDFWGTVLRESFSESGSSEEEVLEAWNTVARPTSLVSLRYPRLRSTWFQRQLSTYRTFLGTLYRIVSQHSGKRVIVDSSGSPLHGYIISGVTEVEVAMVHLVRDARAVAFSDLRPKPNPSEPEPEATMTTNPSLRVATTWLVYNYLLENLRSEFENYYFSRYEDLFEYPEMEFGKMADELKLDHELNSKLMNSKINMSKKHMGQGNPSRYKEGKIELRKDLQWKKEMNKIRNKSMKMICYSKMRKYSYT